MWSVQALSADHRPSMAAASGLVTPVRTLPSTDTGAISQEMSLSLGERTDGSTDTTR